MECWNKLFEELKSCFNKVKVIFVKEPVYVAPSVTDDAIGTGVSSNAIKTNGAENSITKSVSIKEPVYVDLAPIDNADEKGIYTKALKFATDNKKIFNIALTGPYGSGKSSIINTFLKSYRKPTLKISLAAFASEHGLNNSEPDEGENGKNSAYKAYKNESKITKQEIERSILQQILHGEKADKLTFSRFKKIKFPKCSLITSLFITIGLLDFWYLIQQKAKIFEVNFLKPFDVSNLLHLGSLFVGFLCLWKISHFLYIKSFGLYIKSISMKEIGFSSDVADKESILNRHLDEIIYFFQVTNYELVVIEDLDRFKNPDIFVTLREINSLINANSGVNRIVRFLYALRDDMFVSNDRTKFFEFIIPVIPIINISNSIDKVWERVNKLSLNDKIDGGFIRDVSRYLNDLRLINNIFNEYNIYNESIDNETSGSLDKKKLLAILIYKNLLPNDFEELHRGKGYLADILNRHNYLIAITEKKYKSQISEIEAQIVDAEKQVPHDLDELRNIYAMALINKAPENSTYFEFNGNYSSINTLSKHPEFDSIMEEGSIRFRNASSGPYMVNVSGLQTEVNPNKTFKQRKQETENKSTRFKESASKNISELRTKIASLRLAKFNEIMRENAKETEALFNKFGDNKELMRYLVFEGYIDDTYHQYTSLFHSGRLSQDDNKFLKRIRGFNNPEPDFQIDNPDEVIAEMRDTDFSQNYVLNIKLVDGLFENQSKYSEKISKLLEFVSNNFDKCEDFLSSYYETGKQAGKFIESLSIKWSGYVLSAVSSPKNISHVTQMLARLTDDRLIELSSKNVRLSEFVSERLSEILALKIDFEPNKLKCLNFEIKDLSSVKAYDAVKALLIEEGLYQISIANVEFIFEEVLGATDLTGLKTKHYSTVLASGNEKLIEKVEQDFEHYFETILRQLENNSEEDAETIIKVINHKEIDTEIIQEFLEQQSAKLPSLENVPDNLHALLFKLQKIETSWANCLAFILSDSFDEEILTAYLQQKDTKDILTKRTIERQEDKEYKLSSFLIHNENIDDDIYRDYVKASAWKFTGFPKNLNIEKIKILIEERKITFSSDSMSFLDDSRELQVLFVAKNIDKYFEISDEITIDDDFREELLKSDIIDEHKLKIIEAMDLTVLSGLPSRTELIVEIINRNFGNAINLEANNAQALIINSKPINIQISLFNKFHNILSDAQVSDVIKNLPYPFSKITHGRHSPVIPSTPENKELATWLKRRSLISSWSHRGLMNNEIRINLRRR